MTVDGTRPALWIFLHLPKSGGTTLKIHLEKHLRWEEELIEFSRWGRSFRSTHGLPEFADRPVESRSRARVLAGHDLGFGVHRLIPNREPRYFTFVRDPADRCASLYNFRRSRGVTPLGFDEWYDTEYLPHHRESMVRFFASRLAGQALADRPEEHLSLAKTLLKRCWHVGTARTLDASLGLLCDAIGIPRGWETVRSAGSSSALSSPTHPDRGERIERHFTPTEATRARVYADSPCDLALLRWVEAGGAD